MQIAHWPWWYVVFCQKFETFDFTKKAMLNNSKNLYFKKKIITYPDDPTNSQYFWTQSSMDFQNIRKTIFDGINAKYLSRPSFEIWIGHNQMWSLNNHPLHMSPKLLEFLLQLYLSLYLVRKLLELAFHLKNILGVHCTYFNNNQLIDSINKFGNYETTGTLKKHL